MAAVEAGESLDPLLALIEKLWGYRALRPLQEPAMRACLNRRDSLVVLPTGGGKSLCYQAPAIHLSQSGQGPTVVVSPLIALMKDQVDSLRELGVAAAQLDSSLSLEDRRAVAADMRAGRLHMLFVSPERLVGEGGDWMQGLLRDSGVRTFAIDEAHCISHWGHDFRPEYRQLARLKEFFPEAAVHAFTATATEQVRKDIASLLKLNDPEILVGNFDRPNLTYRILPRHDLFGQIHEVLDRHEGEAGIIYCMRRKDVDQIAATLNETKELKGKVVGYHAGMTPQLRRKVQEAFIGEECDVIVATIAFGMGIDRSNIRFVLHVACPKSIEAYQQETGRAGRDGLEAECVLLYSGGDAMTWRSIIEKSAMEAGSTGIRLDPAFVPAALKHIDDMDRFARGAVCRHKALVEHFGQAYAGPPAAGNGDEDEDERAGLAGCGACDMCLGDTTPVPEATVVAQKILSAVARTKETFGAAHVISVLRGENVEGVRKRGHETLSVFGLLASFSKPEVRDYIYQLVGQGLLAQENLQLASGFTAAILKLNEASWEVMRGQRQARLVQLVRKSAAESQKTRGQEVSWEGVDKGLFETLRALRRELAHQRNVPPYQVFSDATLREMARMRPTKAANFRLVYGIGDNKAREYAAHFLPAIGDYCKAHELSTDNIAKPPPPRPAPSAGLQLAASRREAAGYFRQNMTVDEVARRMNRAPSTVREYLADFIVQEKPATIRSWVPDEVYQRVAAAAMQTGMHPLRPLFVALEEKVPYDQIRLVTAHLQAQGKG